MSRNFYTQISHLRRKVIVVTQCDMWQHIRFNLNHPGLTRAQEQQLCCRTTVVNRWNQS